MQRYSLISSGRWGALTHPLWALVATIAVITIPTRAALGQPEIPVLVKPPVAAKIMALIDDSGSMNAVLEHPEFVYNDSCSTNTANDIPSVIFKLVSGSAAAATTHSLAPMLVEYNPGFYFSTSTTTDGFASKAFNAPSTFPIVQYMSCNNSSGNSVCCPGTSGSSCPKTGINTGALFGSPSVTGANVFQLSNLANSSGTPITDSTGNEYLYLKYRGNVYENSYDDWATVWAIFNASGVLQTNYTSAYATTGGTVVFNGKEVFLSQGWYRKEYLRWIFYCASAGQLSNLPGITRIQSVKDVMTTVINTNPSVSFGLASLNGSTFSSGVHSGYLDEQWYTPSGNGTMCARPRIRRAIGTAAATLISELATMTARGGTPLTRSYIETLRYFSGGTDADSCTSTSAAYTSPISGQCDAHVVITLTDGLPTSEGSVRWPNGAYPTNVDGVSNPAANMSSCSSDSCYSSFFPDSSWWAYHTDLRASVPGIQNLISYAIAFGVSRYPLLDRFAQTGGSGVPYTPTNSTELTNALQDIVNVVFDTPTSGAGVATLEKLYGETKVYQPVFYADTWVGKIQVFNYNTATEELEFDYDMSDLLETRDLTTSPRTIIAGSDPDFDGRTNTTIDFSVANAATLRPQLFRAYDLGTLSSALLATPIVAYSTTTAAETLIRFIQGEAIANMRERDRDADGYVDRLGDIVYSRPLEVGAKNGNYTTLAGYSDFIAGLQSEPRILLAGANDGMIHAFDSQTGVELWAYIPSSQLSYLERLGRMTYNTQYRRSYVDGPITVEDVYRNGSWRTLAMFGLRTGGSTYTVLDITDRQNPSLVWEVSDPTLYGQSWTKPVVVISNASASSSDPDDFTWTMVVGTGEAKTTAGTNLVMYNLDSVTPPAASSLTLSASDAAGNRTTGAATSQNDADRNVDRLYVGTEVGDVYRVRVSGAPASWTAARLFDGAATQPIVATPILVLADNPQYTPSGSGAASMPLAVGVYFGTGRHDQTSDITTVGGVSQSIFGIFDPADTSADAYANVLTSVTNTTLQDQSASAFNIRRDATSGKYFVPTGKVGFRIPLATTVTVASGNFIEPVGEVVNPPVNVRGEILFSTFSPDTGSCDIGGLSFLQAVHFQTGGGAVVDFNRDPDHPFYNGGIPDINASGTYTSADLTAGITQHKLEPVFDTAVSSVDLTDLVTPYDHDGSLTSADVRLHASNGGIMPALSAVGHTGLPGSPSVLLSAKKVVIPEAYPSDPTSGGTAGEDGDPGATDQMPPPKLLPMNIYNIPVEILSFHEVTGH